VFLAFTLSQLGMVTRWWRRRASGWRRGMAVNGLGAALSAAVLLVVVATKFAQGAWLVVVLVPLLMATALAVHRHYAAVRRITAVASSKRPSARLQEDENSPSVVAVLCVVPVSRLDRPTLRALAYAAALGQPLLAVHLSPAPGEAARS
jgi:hypothetical protein